MKVSNKMETWKYFIQNKFFFQFIDSETFRKIIKFERTLTLLYLAASSFTGLGMVIAPAAINFYTEDFYAEMPVKSAFLYDITQMPAYIATYALFTYVVYTTVLISVSFI